MFSFAHMYNVVAMLRMCILPHHKKGFTGTSKASRAYHAGVNSIDDGNIGRAHRFDLAYL